MFRARQTLVGVDILVVFSLLSLGTRCVDWAVRELLTLLQAGRDTDAVNSPGLLVLLPGGAGDVTADNSFDGQNAELAHLHRAVLQNRAERLGDLGWEVEGKEVRAECRDSLLEDLEPGLGTKSKKDALVGNTLVPEA